MTNVVEMKSFRLYHRASVRHAESFVKVDPVIEGLLTLLAQVVAWSVADGLTDAERAAYQAQAQAYARAVGVAADPHNPDKAMHAAKIAGDLVQAGAVVADDIARMMQAVTGPVDGHA